MRGLAPVGGARYRSREARVGLVSRFALEGRLMQLRSLVKDCLYLNWALPVEVLPELPEPLRYELHEGQGGYHAFASALLFRQAGAHFAALPFVRLSHPQFNFRFCVLDGEGIPSVLFRRMIVPVWVVPGGWLARQNLRGGRFDYPAEDAFAEGETWRWTVERRGVFTVEARRSAPGVGAGPRFSSWEAAVHYFRHRPRGYQLDRRGLHRVETDHPRVTVWPMAAEVTEAGLLERNLSLSPWPALHSAFLCPEIPFVFEVATVPEKVARLARPAAPVAADPAMLARTRRSRPRQTAA